MLNKKQQMQMKNKQEPMLKFLTDFLPLILFFAVFKLSDHSQPIIPATTCLVVSTIIALTISHILTKKIAKMPLFSAIILGFFGGLTIFSGNEIFIKMKPTLINLLFSAVLLFGYFSKKPLMQYLFDGAIHMSKEAWLTFSLRWGLFFIALAILNEIIWRNFSTDFWVQFKVFGILPISIIFTMVNIPFIMKNSKEKIKT